MKDAPKSLITQEITRVLGNAPRIRDKNQISISYYVITVVNLQRNRWI
jgi:hypothetical protein